MNIYDIASKAGVSIATVSRVLNNNKNVSEKTRNKILDIMKDEEYTPNGVARSLATNRSKTIGILVPDIRNNFHFESAYAIEKLLYKSGYVSILCNTGESLKDKINYINVLRSKKVDGIITIGAVYGEEELLDILKKIHTNIPVVLLNNYDKGLLSVYCDEASGIIEAVNYLFNKGYKKPIFVSDKKAFKTRAYKEKIRGFSLGVKNRCKFIEMQVENDDDFDELIDYITQNHVDAIQFEKDTIAIKFLSKVLGKEINIPQDLGIIGFDNIDLTNHTRLKISSVDHKINTHADIAVSVLLKALEGNVEDVNIVIKPEFIAKETTR
ncbi:LacI family DNA-binding transcriptional regulator [Peptoniphilus equinus]|uniref:LacI family DNA-binding transcriptional regulator n=1 Tax=Peptoniphilus equinus TaxID=3016343 RepID=A0ABY7QVW7_9FIRM|nr:LacI family DNA-binding transcriptional regulator [Peptoniphilus equinus]WBW50415.1 LacI family DNA-binding transcriptional regulator [Peptoniphilus equinus]